MRWNKRVGFFYAGLLLCSGLVLPWLVPSSRVPSKPASKPTPSPTPASLFRELPKRNTLEFFVMIDPSHGGQEKGALLSGNISEKDVTLAWARELRRQLEERGVPSRLLRESDQTLSLDRRAEIANEARPAIYVALHAAPVGSGVRVYAPAVPFAAPSSSGRFLSWETAQNASLERSRSVARAVAVEIRKQDSRTNAFAVPLRPLNNMVVPAIAVEFATSARQSENQKRQSALASAIASGIAQVRSQLGVRP
jgi:N-acetylmuramoyl-L-alanine amidase